MVSSREMEEVSRGRCLVFAEDGVDHVPQRNCFTAITNRRVSWSFLGGRFQKKQHKEGIRDANSAKEGCCDQAARW